MLFFSYTFTSMIQLVIRISSNIFATQEEVHIIDWRHVLPALNKSSFPVSLLFCTPVSRFKRAVAAYFSASLLSHFPKWAMQLQQFLSSKLLLFQKPASPLFAPVSAFKGFPFPIFSTTTLTASSGFRSHQHFSYPRVTQWKVHYYPVWNFQPFLMLCFMYLVFQTSDISSHTV